MKTRHILVAASAFCVAAASPLAWAQEQSENAAELQQLREEMRQMQQDYQRRLNALEKRIESAEQDADDEPAVAQSTPAIGSGGRGFNPKIGAILQGTAISYGEDPEGAGIPGVLLGPETELRPEGLSLRESEISLEANIDNYFRAWMTVALENEEGEEDVVALEEAYIDSLALPYGLSLRFGRWFNEIGYQNTQHSHAWDFVDAPLPLRAFLARQLNDDGLQLRWLAPTPFFWELGAELLRGSEFPAGGEDRNGVDNLIGFTRFGGDIGDSSSWRLGLSALRSDAQGRESGEEDSDEVFAFTGESDLYVIDGVYKWAPRGNWRQRNFTAQFEYFIRNEDGELAFDDGVGGGAVTDYDGDASGFYVQGVYQFMPRWRAGLRYDRLDIDNSFAMPAAEFDELSDDSDNPQRYSAMLDWSGSEFSRIRLQYNRDESRPDGETDNQWLLQYIMSIGAHPAHNF